MHKKRKKPSFFHTDFPLRGGWGYPPIPLRKKTFFLGPKTLFFAFFYALLALFGPLYGLFGPFLTLFNEKKTSFLALLGKNFPEKHSGLSVKGGVGVPPLSAKEKNLFFSHCFSGKGGGGGGYPL